MNRRGETQRLYRYRPAGPECSRWHHTTPPQNRTQLGVGAEERGQAINNKKEEEEEGKSSGSRSR
jgi:hypothetical protein